MRCQMSFLAGMAGIFATAVSGVVCAATGSGTSEIIGTPPALTVEELQPYQMTLERLPSTPIGATIDLKTEWSSTLAVDPETTVQPGCIRVTGDANASVGISVIDVGTPTAPDGSTISFSGTPRIEISTATDSCASAISATGNITSAGGISVSATTSFAGELYIAWQYRQPVSGSTGTMIVDSFVEDTYSSSVDFQIDYQQ